MSHSYWINTFRLVRDHDRLAAYAALAGPVMAAHGGRFLARGVPRRVFEHGVMERTTLIRFDSAERAVAAYESAAYQHALGVLGDAADRDIRIVDAVPSTADDPEQLVVALVRDVMNGGDLDRLDELCTPQLAPKLRRAVTEFRQAFPDWRQEILETVSDGSTVVARMRCRGTHAGTWQGLAATGRTMRVDEVHFVRTAQGRITGLWGLEDTWTRWRQLAGDDATLGELGSLG